MHEYPWGHTRRFNAYPEYFKKIFGGRVQKLTIDAGFTCPNRDGTVGYGGCTYCNNDAFNPSYCDPSKTVTQQIKEGMEFHANRYRRAKSFLAYFQAYSNTYDNLDRLKELYSEALSFPEVIGLVIGTRPDCVDDEKLEYFELLNKDYYILIEYGIESTYNATLNKINRGHTYEQGVKAIEKTISRSIRTGIHMIFGLPGESREQMLDQVDVISALPLTSIKFHQLQIVKGTAMEIEYNQHPSGFNLFGMDEYIDFCVDFMERLNPSFVVERIAGEVPPRFIVSDMWKPRYDVILNKFEKRLAERNTWQGKNYVAQ